MPKNKENENAYDFKNAKYIETYDGDTFYVDIPSLHPIFGQRLGVRIKGIDTPEIRSSNKYEKLLGKKAKAETEKILESSKKIVLKNCTKGTFSRIVCDIETDTCEDLGKHLIENGFAEKYE